MNSTCFHVFSVFWLTSSEDGLCCQIVSQLGQVGVFPVVQLPARDAQVEPQPGRVSLFITCPSGFIIAFLLTGALPAGMAKKTRKKQNHKHAGFGENKMKWWFQVFSLNCFPEAHGKIHKGFPLSITTHTYLKLYSFSKITASATTGNCGVPQSSLLGAEYLFLT